MIDQDKSLTKDKRAIRSRIDQNNSVDSTAKWIDSQPSSTAHEEPRRGGVAIWRMGDQANWSQLDDWGKS